MQDVRILRSLESWRRAGVALNPEIQKEGPEHLVPS